jgi:hypothetical protein
MSRHSLRTLAYTLLGGLGIWLGLGLGGCRSAPAARPTGTLLLSVTPAGTTLLLDDRPLPARSGEALLRVAMAPGPHRLELRAPGYFTAYRDVAVVAATEQRLSVALRPDPDAAPISTTPARPLGELPQPSGELP